MASFSGPAWRKQVGLLPAESAWWHDKVGEHFPETDIDLLSRLDLTGNTLKWEVSRLSSGERQRLALIRLLCNNPRVLLLDEPTANLDQKNIDRVEALIDHWRRQHQSAVLWVSHDPDQQQRVSQAHWYIADSRLKAAG
jgi:ABC-type iron transport system FetAB ATPase subunit